MYIPFPHLQQALDSGEIHVHRDADTGAIIGYLWLKDLKKKPVTKIEEIVSVRHGLGSEMIDWAKRHARHPVIELKVVDYNTAAIEFYQKRGFREVSRETGKKINNITMQYKRV